MVEKELIAGQTEKQKRLDMIWQCNDLLDKIPTIKKENTEELRKLATDFHTLRKSIQNSFEKDQIKGSGPKTTDSGLLLRFAGAVTTWMEQNNGEFKKLRDKVANEKLDFSEKTKIVDKMNEILKPYGVVLQERS